jgi:hypothetical protein
MLSKLKFEERHFPFLCGLTDFFLDHNLGKELGSGRSSLCGILSSPFAGLPFFLGTRLAAIILAKPVRFWHFLDLVFQPLLELSVRCLRKF